MGVGAGVRGEVETRQTAARRRGEGSTVQSPWEGVRQTTARVKRRMRKECFLPDSSVLPKPSERCESGESSVRLLSEIRPVRGRVRVPVCAVRCP